MKQKSLLHSLAALLLFALSAYAQSFENIETGTTGELDEGIALFLPKGLESENIPYSLCLVKQPRPERPLAADWKLRPEFFKSDTQSRVTLAVPAGTSLYGTGEVTGPLLRNGKAITLWNTDNGAYQDDDGKRLYQSHPWVLGVRADGSAFGFLADTTWRAEMNLENGIEFTSEGPLFDVIVIDRASPQEVMRGLAELTGTMPLPPRWALGYQQCRYSYHPDTRVKEIADELRKRKIPCDVIWMDIHYMDGYRIFTFNPTEFPDPKGLDEYLHEHAFKSVWMIDPGVKAETGYGVYDEGKKRDVFVKTAQGEEFNGKAWPGECAFPDFTRPETRAWWSGLYMNFMAQGVDGVWNDVNEPAVFVPSKTMPIDNMHRGGGELQPGPHLQYHNVYGMLMVRASQEGIAAANPDKRPFVLTRANFLGGQRFAATWTGDNASSWEHLKMSVPMSINLGLSGQPFNGPDIGGFLGSPSPELWGNWIAIGAFYPFSRGHACDGTPDKEPWAFGEEVEKAARTALERRYRLLPYLYTLFYTSSLNGMPVMQPVFFADPSDPALRAEDRAFLVGANLLVVPRWSEQPHLPKGIWRPMPIDAEKDAPDKFQPELKIRGGSIVPMGKIVQSTNEESFDPLTLVVCLDENGKADGQLFEDAGEGFGYKHGDYLLTNYHAEKRGEDVIVTVAKFEGKRARPNRDVSIEVVTDGGVVHGHGSESKEIVVSAK